MIKKEITSISFSGDKSIAHRLLLISLLVDKKITINNLPKGKDVATTAKIVRKLVPYSIKNTLPEKNTKTEPKGWLTLDCENSGTTARLLCGILANLKGCFKLVGDGSLSKRPMERVVKPLAELMEVDIKSTGGCLPVYIRGTGKAKPIVFDNDTGSAQVKSAVLFAAFASRLKTSVIEKVKSRDHSERLLSYIERNKEKDELFFDIPGDISSAAYFIVASAISGKIIKIKNILLNPTRTGFLKVLERMGVSFEKREFSVDWEPVGDLVVKGGNLVSTQIAPEEIPSLIDELPILAVAMAFAKGKSTLSGASELRVKESDRIKGLVSQFQKVGIDCVEKKDGFEILGGCRLKPAILDSFGDHRLAMTFAVLAKCSRENISVLSMDSVDISFPEFNSYIDKYSYIFDNGEL